MSAPDEKRISTAPDDAAELIAPNVDDELICTDPGSVDEMISRLPRITSDDQISEDSIRGRCPECIAKNIKTPLVSMFFHVGGKGYLLVWLCAGNLKDPQTCTFRRIM